MFQKIDSKKLTRLCEEKSVSFEHLAQLTGIHLRSLQRIERTGFVASQDLKAVCSILGIKPREILLPTPMSPF